MLHRKRQSSMTFSGIGGQRLYISAVNDRHQLKLTLGDNKMEASDQETTNRTLTNTPTAIADRIKILSERLARYIPPRETWTPADEALFGPTDLYRVPVDDARAMQLKAISWAFERHYQLNHFYRKYCEMRGVSPEDIRTYDDLERIPLVPDLTFKQHPSGEDFAHWIANIYAGELPTVVIEKENPSFDDVINAFNAAGLVVGYSSGTSGRHTVIPRDMRTYLTQLYASSKMMFCLYDWTAVDHALLVVPKPSQEMNLWIGKALQNMLDMFDDAHYAMDFEISADMILKAMSETEQLAAEPPTADERQRKTMEIAIKWLEGYDKTNDSILVVTLPFIINSLMDTLEQEGRHFEFGERGMIQTGGGWKMEEHKRVSRRDFRKRVEEVFGIPETNCCDSYASVEIGGAVVLACPEGHYLHMPYTWWKPLVLDRSLTPAGYGEKGRFAFLDALAGSYPGFIITGDEVRMLEQCPVCDRPGPVLEPEVRRAKGEEVRGCSEELLRIFAETVRGDN
jgi:hypothetical protein